MADFIRIHTPDEKRCKLLNTEHIERIDEHPSGTRILAKIHMLNGDWFVSDESFDDVFGMLRCTGKVASKPIESDELWKKFMQKID